MSDNDTKGIKSYVDEDLGSNSVKVDRKQTVSLSDVILAIESRQRVLNRGELSQACLSSIVIGVGSLDEATTGELSFIVDRTHKDALINSNASVILVAPDLVQSVPIDAQPIVVASPYLAYASTSSLFEFGGVTDEIRANKKADEKIANVSKPKIHKSAQVADSAILGENVTVGAFCVIGEHSEIGQGTTIQSHVHIGDDVKIGEQCVIYPQVVIQYQCQIADRVRIHAQASIGSEGFGFAPTQDPATKGWERIAQLGRVIIGSNVRIGSQTCIDRGAIGDTIIADNVIIDNLVQIAHNVHIGAGCAIAANTGIAGSTHIGKRCMIGGAVGIAGHLTIADDVTLTGMTMVTKSIKQAGTYSSGTVAMPSMQWRRAAIGFRNMGKKL